MLKAVKPLSEGTRVTWKWRDKTVEGVVRKVFVKPVSRVLRGAPYKRNGSPEKPAYLVESVGGNDVLKSHSELTKKS